MARPRYSSPLLAEAGTIFGFGTTPLFPDSPPETGRYGALVVLGHDKDLIAVGVLDGVWASMPALADAAGRPLLRRNRFASRNEPVAFGSAPDWTVELRELTRLGDAPLDDEQQRIAARYLGGKMLGRSFTPASAAASEVEGEWRWANDRDALVRELELDQERRAREQAAAQERYETRLKGLTWEQLLSETPFARWDPSPPFPPADFRDAAAERVRETLRDLQALGPKPRKAEVRKAVSSLLRRLKDQDAAAGFVLDTEERDDIHLLLEEIAHVAGHPSLLGELEDWYTW